MPIDPKTICEVIVYGNHSGAGRGFQITRNYQATADTPPNESYVWQDVCEQMAVQMATSDFLDAWPIGTTIVGVRVRSVGAPGYWPYGIGLSLAGSGSSGDILPEGMGPLVQFYPETPEEGRRGFTRLFWPIISEADNEDGMISTDYASKIAIALLEMDNASISGVTLEPVIVSHKYDDVTLVSNYRVQDRIAYIRRRYRTPQGQFAI